MGLRRVIYFITCWMCLQATSISGRAQALQPEMEEFERIVRISKSRATRYEYLNHISDQTGYFFLYDSRSIPNDQVLRLKKGEYTLREAIGLIVDIPDLLPRISGNHILLQLPRKDQNSDRVPEPEKTPDAFFRKVSGVVKDRISGDPVSHCSIAFRDRNTGTITNQEGEFTLYYPDSLRSSQLIISHIGYQKQEFDAEFLEEQYSQFSLDPRVVPLQEVVVRPVDPYKAIGDMLRNKETNYPENPAELKAFYREKIEYRKKNIALTEGIFRVYYSGYSPFPEGDQIRLVKMRKIIDPDRNPDQLPQIKAGIHAALQTDIIKHLPDFLQPESETFPYDLIHSDITYLNGRHIHVIRFEQKKHIEEPFWRGELFIDAENHALVEARFEVHPDYVREATPAYVIRTGKGVRLTLLSASYTVSYQCAEDGKYYLHRSHGELEFRSRIKKSGFASLLKFSVELVNCDINTRTAAPFPRNKRLETQNIFAQTQHPYDADFWKDFNTILPEEKLRELIRNQLSEVTEGDPEFF